MSAWQRADTRPATTSDYLNNLAAARYVRVRTLRQKSNTRCACVFSQYVIAGRSK